MSADFSAMALIGLKVDKHRLYTKQKVKAFQHEYPADMLFCPKTGKKLWAFEEVPIPAFDDEETLVGYKVVSGTDGEPFYVCLELADDTGVNGGNNDRLTYLHAPSLNIQVYDFMIKMIDLGLWDEDEFGLWAVTVVYCQSPKIEPKEKLKYV